MSILRLEDTMPRNTKCRKIFCFPDYYGFVPEEVGADHIETILMSLDEYEVIRLLDYEGLNQQECALRMDVARTVEGKRLRIAGGNVKIDRERIGVPVNLKSKGGKAMRAAVTYDNGNVFGHFGKTEKFKIYDIENGKIVNSQILDTNGEGCGALAGILNIANVDVLICGGIGGGAVHAIKEAGIRLYAGANGSADAAVEALLAGTLEAKEEANCDHHDHDHSEGHSCGHGNCHK